MSYPTETGPPGSPVSSTVALAAVPSSSNEVRLVVWFQIKQTISRLLPALFRRGAELSTQLLAHVTTASVVIVSGSW